MIESLSVRNFQKWKSLEVELAPVTTFVGRSGSGKSSLLRFIRWAILNRPNGNSFVRKGASGCKGTLVVDGKSVSRVRSKDKNAYRLEGEEFAALGAGGVPEQIAKLLNADEQNFARQHDAAMWFSLTPGQVSQELNGIVNLSLIDDTLANAGAAVRKIKAGIGESEERLEAAKKRQAELAWAVDAQTDLQALEERERELAALSHRTAKLGALIEKGKEVERQADLAIDAGREAAIDLSKLEKLAETYKTASGRTGRLVDLVESLKQTDNDLCQAKIELAQEKQRLEKLSVGKCPLCGK